MTQKAAVAVPKRLQDGIAQTLVQKTRSTSKRIKANALSDFLYLLQTHNDDPEVLEDVYSALIELSQASEDDEVRSFAAAAVSQYRSPREMFDWSTHIAELPNQYWQAHPTDPDIVSVPAGLFIMGSKNDTGVAIPTMMDPAGNRLDSRAYISEAVALQYGNGTVTSVPSYQDERPEHTAYLGDFEIGKAPVTNEQYMVFINATGRPAPNHWVNGVMPYDSEQVPVVYVSWHDAMAYCEWLTSRWRDSGRLGPTDIVRLPSELEWEKAARGIDGRAYPWGNEFLPKLCNYRLSPFGKPIPVGSFPPASDSPYGCKDMAGNVWDWTLTKWGRSARKAQYQYPYNRSDGREAAGGTDMIRRVVRGGAYHWTFDCLRSPVRNRSYPFTRHPAGSFRVAVMRSLSSQEDIETSPWLTQKF